MVEGTGDICMKRFFLFDVDETLWVSGGPINRPVLETLRNFRNIVGICGNYAMFTINVVGWEHLVSVIGPIGGITKRKMMEDLKKYVYAEEYIMVGNENPSNSVISDKAEAEGASWRFIEATEFVKIGGTLI